jgi:hypothetical protein
MTPAITGPATDPSVSSSVWIPNDRPIDAEQPLHRPERGLRGRQRDDQEDWQERVDHLLGHPAPKAAQPRVVTFEGWRFAEATSS